MGGHLQLAGPMSKQHATISADETIALFELNLKNRSLAAVLAWLVPGLGHLYQGRTTKGLLFMITIVSTFAFGYAIGGGRVVYAGTEPLALQGESIGGRVGRVVMSHWKVACQSGIGSVAIPCVIERQRALAGKGPLLGEAFRPPDMSGRFPLPTHTDDNGREVRHPNELAKWQYQGGFAFELGTVYTVIAGLLNVLVIYDAFAGPLVTRAVEADKEPHPPEPKGADR